MITIYANWTGNSLSRGETLDEARAKLNAGHCDADTVFGWGATDVTALDTGPHETLLPTRDRFDLLHIARQSFAEVSAKGPARLK